MSLWCRECASRVYDRKGCPKCGPMAVIDSVPPIRGYLWMGVGADAHMNPHLDPDARGRRQGEREASHRQSQT